MATYRFEADTLILGLDPRDTSQAIVEAYVAARARPEFRPGVRLIFDQRGGRGTTATEEIERRMALFASAIGMVSSRAAVVVDDVAEYGLARVAAVHARRYGAVLGVFWSLDDARTWSSTFPSSAEPTED